MSPAAENVWLVEVSPRDGILDPEGRSALTTLREWGIGRGGAGSPGSLRDVRSSRLYELAGALSRDEAEEAAALALADPVTESYAVRRSHPSPVGERASAGWRGRGEGPLVLAVVRRQGVMDPVVASARKALGDLGLGPDRLRSVRTGRRYAILGSLSDAEVELVARRVLSNPLIEDVLLGADAAFPPRASPARALSRRREEVPLLRDGIAAIEAENRRRGLSLSPVEIAAIARRFETVEKRDPTVAELETIAQTWSEHCKHKTFAGPVRFVGEDGRERRYENLLRETIGRATSELARPWCLSVFEDNAGVVDFDPSRRLAVAMKVETHNHPSALEPYGGAGTGVGGVIRDILGTGLGARPIAGTDVFCFGPPDLAPEDVPAGALHPRQVARGVVAGVRDYANRMGIPTVSGAVLFDPRYVGNPLVYCGTVGLIPHDKIAKEPRAGDRIVVAGGPTGRDGIHGATFSSAELHDASERVSSGAVQIGNAIEERRLHDVLLAARDRGLFRAVTDCGAGGLSSAVGEMGERLGAAVALERVPLKYEGLSPDEIWISEAQERMVFAVPPERVDELIRLFASEDVEAKDLGEFTGDGRLSLTYEDVRVAELDMAFLHDGCPRVERRARAPAPRRPPEPGSDRYGPGATGRYDDDLLAVLASWNVCSKEWIVRQYDHEVQGTSAVKPFVGVISEGPSDAAVLAPVRGERRGIAIACGINPRYGDLDPYRMAMAAVDEAIRNAVAVGADPDRVALLDNFCFGDTSREEVLGSLVLAAEGCRDAALGFGAPFISGKDSLNNEFRTADGRRIAVPPTLLISALAIHPDVSRAVTMDLKGPDHLLYIVGATGDELGGSHFRLVRGRPTSRAGNAAGGGGAGAVPSVEPGRALSAYRAVHGAIAAGLILSCHDVSEGGLAAAAAEMAFAGRQGAQIDLERVPWRPRRGARAGEAAAGCTEAGEAGPSDSALLFSESCSRLLLEVEDEERGAALERILAEAAPPGEAPIPFARIGRTVAEGPGGESPRLRIHGLDGKNVIDVDVDSAARAFGEPLPHALGGDWPAPPPPGPSAGSR